MQNQSAKIGVIGLGVMGSNLALNIEEKGWTCVAYERDAGLLNKFFNEQSEKNFLKAETLEALVAQLEGPRIILIMIKAGAPVDTVIETLIPLLSKGDVVIDGGNSYYHDTEKRTKKLSEHGINFIGMGVSGGEDGARNGPSLMPGGSKAGWELAKPMLEAIAAKHEKPCVDYIGAGGSGHFVKMVHNGIEYAVMQLLAEAYDLCRLNSCVDEFAVKLAEWNTGRLKSFLVEITAEVLQEKDPQSKRPLVELILDSAGQKGTGRWTAQEALEYGVSIPTISAAVDARILSSRKSERVALSLKYQLNNSPNLPADFFTQLENALFSSILLAFDQGMTLLLEASTVNNWDLDRSKVCSVWRAGCILRGQFLESLMQEYTKDPKISSLMFSEMLGTEIFNGLKSLQLIAATATASGVPCLALSGSLSYLTSLLTETLPQNLTQAQRDNFGAHTYNRVDMCGTFHTEWGKVK